MTTTPYLRTPRIATEQLGAAEAERLRRIWEGRPGIVGWLGTVDHKKLGIRYIVTSFLFLLLGGLEALVMRIQLAQPQMEVLSGAVYNQLFSMHGITMIFLYALPVLTGFSVYLFPLVLGCRDLAFPRLNALTYWIFVAAGLFMYAGFAAGYGPDNGWFNYAPYSARAFNPGPNMDFYALGMIFLGISTTLSSANFVVTALRLRAPGMAISRLPFILWGTTTVSFGNLFAVPAVSLAFFLLWTDRNLGTHFFSGPDGQPLLWQHLFWIFAHPWVYIIVLPAMGMVSMALPVLCRRPLVGYSLVALSTVVTMILGFGVWLHHMFATDLPFLAIAFFSAASFIIVIPSAAAVFSWTATIWTGRPMINTAFLYFASFVPMFVIGGVSGFMTASVPADLQLTDTYFVVAHIHYVLIGINLFAVLGAIHYWFPKMTGRLLDERLGRWGFGLVFLGFNAAFLPMHATGLLGMPRRIYTYAPEMGWSGLNLVTTLATFVLALGFLLVLANIAISRRRGRAAGPNPWDGATLEWSVQSPPPAHNFAVIPVVASRHPLWEDRLDEDAARTTTSRGLVLDDAKEQLITSPLDARPEAIMKVPDDSLWPFLATLAMTAGFAGLLMKSWWLAGVGGGILLLSLLVWLWPERHLAQVATSPRSRSGAVTDADASAPAFPVGWAGRHTVGWWGVLCVIMTEGALFVFLLYSYYYDAALLGRDWLPAELPGFALSGPNTVILVLSSVALRWGEIGIRNGAHGRLALGLALAILLGAAFLAVQGLEWAAKPFSIDSSAYASVYFTVTGFHMAHVAGGVVVLAVMLAWTLLGYFDGERHAAISIGSAYWHFVDVVWVAIFFTFYVTPHLR